jgi:hypothetical protein
MDDLDKYIQKRKKKSSLLPVIMKKSMKNLKLVQFFDKQEKMQV